MLLRRTKRGTTAIGKICISLVSCDLPFQICFHLGFGIRALLRWPAFEPLRCSRMEDCYEGLQFPSAILPTAQLALFMPPKLLRLGRPPASSTNRSTSTHVLSKSCRIACPIFGNPLAPAGLPWIEKQPHWLQKSPVSTRYGRSRSSLLHFWNYPLLKRLSWMTKNPAPLSRAH